MPSLKQSLEDLCASLCGVPAEDYEHFHSIWWELFQERGGIARCLNPEGIDMASLEVVARDVDSTAKLILAAAALPPVHTYAMHEAAAA